MSELDEIRKRKLEELKSKTSGQNVQKMQEDILKKTIFFRLLTKEARERLNRLKVAHPELAQKVEMMIIQSSQMSNVNKIDDNGLKKLLLEIQNQTKKDFKIRK